MLACNSSWQLFVIGLLAIPPVLASPTLQGRGPKCMDFKIPVTATAATKSNITPPENLGDDTVLVDFIVSELSTGAGALLGAVGSVETTGTFQMAMRYCEPEVWIESRANTIQYLQHAITNTKEYWSGLTYPEGFDGEKYSWIEYATSQGYPVLAVDNLGSGESDHPDPVAVVQMTLQVEIIHQVITMLRQGTIPYWGLKGKKFDKVIYAGHSYGSICGNAVATNYPKDVDAYILTGYSGQFLVGLGPLAAGIAIPAAIAMPARFSDLNPFYLAQSVEAGRKEGLYTNVGGYDPAIVTYDFDHEGTVALGELATLFYGVGPADEFTGDIFVITGKQDAIVCNQLVGGADCGSGADSIPAQAAPFFPAAKNYTVHIPDLTGHSANLHYSAPESFKLAHEYLADKGF